MKRLLWFLSYLLHRKQRLREQREWEEAQRQAQARLEWWNDWNQPA